MYLIHGYPGSSWDWIGAGRAPVTAGLLQNARLAGPLIIVTPEASAGTLHDSECLNSTTNGPQLETFLTSTVVSSVDRMFRTLPDRTSRVIGGMSSGGYCALNLGLRHQSEFGTILGIIPYGDPGRNASASMLGNNDAAARDNSPSRYVPTMPVRYPQAVYLSSGTGHGPFFAATSQLARALAQRGEDVSMRTDPSLGHTWRAARTDLPFGLAFAAAHPELVVARPDAHPHHAGRSVDTDPPGRIDLETYPRGRRTSLPHVRGAAATRSTQAVR